MRSNFLVIGKMRMKMHAFMHARPKPPPRLCTLTMECHVMRSPLGISLEELVSDHYQRHIWLAYYVAGLRSYPFPFLHYSSKAGGTLPKL